MNLQQKIIQAIDTAKKQGDSVVALMIDDFTDDDHAMILYEVLWYARSQGIDVVFITPVERKNARQEN